MRDYLDEIHRSDVDHSGGRGRDPVGMRRLLRSLARNTATEAAQATLASDAGGERPLHRDTVRAYIDALERVFVVEDQPAWSARLRSRSRLRRASKRHFVDPSLAVAALRAGPRRLERDLELLGLLFESLAVRDLRLYAGAHDAGVFHYRDNTGLEVDAVVETAPGEWARRGGRTRRRQSHRRPRPAICSSCATGSTRTQSASRPSWSSSPPSEATAMTVPDGVAVVPITALGP